MGFKREGGKERRENLNSIFLFKRERELNFFILQGL